MSVYKKVDTNLNFVDREKEIMQFWQENDILNKSIEKDGEATYTFYDGPPTANGQPHIGHVETRAFKDLIPRFHAMKGNYVPRKAGWDTHGLPVELEVEKLLGLDGKEQIEEYGLAPFIDKCKESVWKYKGMWEEFSDIVAFWADMEKPYVTYSNDFIESEWWALKEIWNKGLLYKGFKIVPYCPRCGTPLSSHEVAQGYKDVKERSAIARFKVKDEDAFILAWTTTPWTLPSNVALCVNPNEEYAKVKMLEDGKIYYLAKALANKVLGEESYELLDSFKGKSLEYKEYTPLFDFVNPDKKCFYVTCADFVTLSDGTGVVHIAPAFGEDDNKVGASYDLPFVQLVDTKGEMTEQTKWPGVFCKDADKEILMDLKERGLLFSAPKYEHSYPHCWRCDTPLIYYARDSWFIKMTSVKQKLIDNNKTINWVPDNIGTGRFGDWLENVQDWGVSRNRYWGTPLNIWECECGHKHSIGGVDELRKMSPNCPSEIELHRPYIDDVTITCPECQKQMTRVPEVVDCWFDSGAMPFAQHHYPFENKHLFQTQFPADFICEAVDQTRGWFYSLLAISTLIFDVAPFKNVLVLGHVQDENGQKMSKSKGNAVQPMDALAQHGADAIRWYFYTASAPWLPKRYSDKIVQEGQRKFLGTLWNTYAFFVLYANIDEFNANDYKLEADKLSLMDKWLLSKLNSLVKNVDTYLTNFQIPEAARCLQEFTDDMSNWYVRRSRERFWGKDMPQDKINAYMSLHTALVTVAKLCAPLIPFLSENIYQNLVCSIDKNAPISVHLCAYPTSDENYIDKNIESQMDAVLKIVVLGRAARNGSARKNRQPLAKMFVKADETISEDYINIIAEELNVKEIEMTNDVSEFTSYNFKPQLKTLGPKYGKQLGEIREALSKIDGLKAKAELDDNSYLTLNISIGEIKLEKEDLLIETVQSERYYTLEDGSITVALDIELTNELIQEGYVREIVSKLQTMRKEAGFNVEDHITFYAKGSEELESVIKDNEKSICEDVLGKQAVFGSVDGFVKEWDINGLNIVLGVKR